MAGDPFKKPVAGEPFVPSARLFGTLIDLANRAVPPPRDPRQLLAERDAGVVLVRNETGGNLPGNAIVALSATGELVIEPADREGVVFERPCFVGHVPVDTGLYHLGLDHPIGILLQPLANNAIGRAVVSGVAWCKTTGSSLLGYANPIDGNFEELQLGGSGPARVIWRAVGEDPAQWTLVALGVAPQQVKFRLKVGETLTEGSSTPAAAQPLVWDGDAWVASAAFLPTPGVFDLYADVSFRGVAWGSDFGRDVVDAYYDHSSRRWQAIGGGHVHVIAFTDDPLDVGGTGTVRLNFTPAEEPEEDVEIEISDTLIPVPQETHFHAFWLSPAVPTDTPGETGQWVAIGALKTGCGIAFDLTNENPLKRGLRVHPGIAGAGLVWDEEFCQLKAEPFECEDVCERLEEVEDRLDTIDERLEQIDQILTDLINCCEYNTACCEENRYCCEYLDQRVDYCCGPGKPGPGDPGGGPPCGRCVWEWNDPEEEPALLEPCSGGGEEECGCNPPTEFDVPGIYFTDCFSTLSGECEQQECPELVILDIPGIEAFDCTNCAAADGAALSLVSSTATECVYETVVDRGPCSDASTSMFVRVTLARAGGAITTAEVEFHTGVDQTGDTIAFYGGDNCDGGSIDCEYEGPGSDPTGSCQFPASCTVRF